MNPSKQPTGIDRLRAVTLAVTDLERSLAFYAGVWGLEVVHRKPGSAFLRAAGTDHHCVVLNEAAQPGLVSVTFGVRDRDSLLALYAQLHAAGVPTEQPPRALPSAGGGWGFALHDPEGRVFKVVADREDHAERLPSAHRPVKLAHVVLNSADADRAAAFFTGMLGFKLSDRTSRMQFVRCNADHHTIALCQDDHASLNHVAFEMASWDELMFGVGRLREAGHEVQWGVGRHGPGDNVFAYFLDPDGLVVEYTAEVQQIDESTHRVGGPADWDRPPERMDRWGLAGLPTPRMREAMHGHGQARAGEEV